MLDRGAVAAKELLDGVERGLGEFFEYAEAEGLRARGINPIEDGDRTTALDPGGATVGELAVASLGVLGAGKAFRALEAS